MKKWMSGFLALVLLAGVCTGCGEKKPPEEDGTPAGVQEEAPSGIYYDITGIDPRETLLEVDGNPVSAELYFYWLTYTCGNMENSLNMYHAYYGLYSELFDEEGVLNWNADFEDGKTLSQQALESAENNMKFYAAIENLAAQRGVVLTEEDEAALDSSITAAEEQLGGSGAFEDYLELMGITRESFRRISADGFLFDRLRELVLAEGDELYRDLGGSIYVDHILISTVDDAGQPLSDEEIAEKRAVAENLLSQLQAAGDLEALFTQLVGEYGEDPGREAEAGYLMDETTNFVQAFKDAALALEVGQLSGVVETDYGFHILLRKDLTAEQRLSLAGDQLSLILEEKMAEAAVVRSEKLDTVEVADFYASYNKAAQAVLAAREAAEGIEDASEGPAAPEGDGSSDETGDAG